MFYNTLHKAVMRI